MAKGSGAGGGAAYMQRNATQMTHQMQNQYRYQQQTKNMVMGGEGGKHQYQNAYKYQNKNGSLNMNSATAE